VNIIWLFLIINGLNEMTVMAAFGGIRIPPSDFLDGGGNSMRNYKQRLPTAVIPPEEITAKRQTFFPRFCMARLWTEVSERAIFMGLRSFFLPQCSINDRRDNDNFYEQDDSCGKTGCQSL